MACPRLKTELEAQVASVTYNPSGKPLTSAQLAELLPGMDGFIAGLDVIDAAALKAADRLKVIARYGVGFDNVDWRLLVHGALVTNTPAPIRFRWRNLRWLLLALARQLPEAVSAVHAGNWPRLSGISLEHKTVGILGLARLVNSLPGACAGSIARILAFDPYADQAFAAENNVELVERDEVVRNA